MSAEAREPIFRCLDCGASYGSTYQPCCSRCMSIGAVVRVGIRPRAAITGAAAVVSARDVAKTQVRRITSRGYEELSLPLRCIALAHGMPGAGKTTFVLRWLDGIEGPVVFWSAEMGATPAFAETLQRCAISRADFLVMAEGSLDDFAALIRARKCKAAAVDSMQRALLVGSDLRDVLNACPTLEVLWGISQMTKSGEARGPLSTAHEADVLVAVDALQWRIEKSRTQPVGLTGPVIADAAPRLRVIEGGINE